MRQARQLLLIVLACLWLLPTGSAAAQGTTATLQEYEALVRAAHAAAQRSDLPGLRAAADQLVPVTGVTLDSGELISADNSWLRDAITVAQPRFQQITERLGAQIELLQLSHERDPEAIAKLRSILSNPPFVPREPSFLERALTNAFEWLDDVLGGLFTAIGFGSLGQACITFIALIGLSLGLVYIVRLLRDVTVREARAKKNQPAVAADEPTTSLGAMDRAQELAAGGDYRSAMRFLYLSTLLWLHERHLLRYDRALTNREVLNSVPPTSPLYSRLQPVVQTFDIVWYGHHELDSATFEQFRRQVAALREGQP